MKYLCLAYGDGADWEALTQAERDELLAQDQRIRDRGAFMSALEPESTVVRAWDGEAATSPGPFAASDRPLVGFSIIEADGVDEVVALVKDTPCARARGAIEIRPLHG